MLTHMVVFKLKKETPSEIIADIEAHMGRLPDAIEEIRHYSFGRDVVQSDRSYDFGLVSRFDDLEAMKRYQVHPDHLALVEKLKAICTDIIAVDFNRPG